MGWCVLVTLTTVGYGDLVRESPPGRAVAITSCCIGTCLVALLVAAVDEFIQFSKAEDITRYALHKSRATRLLRSQAARVITCMFRVGIYKGHASLAHAVFHAE